MDLPSIDPEIILGLCKQLLKEVQQTEGELASKNCVEIASIVEGKYGDFVTRIEACGFITQEKTLAHWRHEGRYPKEVDKKVKFPEGLTDAEIQAEHDRWNYKIQTGEDREEAKAYMDSLVKAQQHHVTKHGTTMKITKTLREVERQLIERKNEAAAWRAQLLALSQIRLDPQIQDNWPEHQRVYANAKHTMETHLYNLENKMPDLSIEIDPLRSAQGEVDRRDFDLKEISDSVQKWNTILPNFSSSWAPEQYVFFQNLRAHLQGLWAAKQEALVRHETKHLPRMLAEEEAQRKYRAAQKAKAKGNRGKKPASRSSSGSDRAGPAPSATKVKSERMSSVDRQGGRGSQAGSRAGSQVSDRSIKPEPMSVDNTPAGGPTWPPRYGSQSGREQSKPSSRSGRRSGRRGRGG